MLEENNETIIEFDDEKPTMNVRDIISLLFISVVVISLLVSMTGCTLSLQTINTSGQASDVVDDNEKADGTISPNLNIPVKTI